MIILPLVGSSKQHSDGRLLTYFHARKSSVHSLCARSVRYTLTLTAYSSACPARRVLLDNSALKFSTLVQVQFSYRTISPQRDDFMHNYTASLPLSRQPVHPPVRLRRVALESSRVLSCDVFVAILRSCAACALRSCWTLRPALLKLRLDMPADTVL